MELLVRSVVKGIGPGSRFKVYGDNRGVIKGWWSGRSHNYQVNEVFKRIHTLLNINRCQVFTRYVSSASNPADQPSRGIFPQNSEILPPVDYSPELEPFILAHDHPSYGIHRQFNNNEDRLNIPTVNLSTLHETGTTVLSPTWIPELGKSLKQGAAGKNLRIQKESQVPLRSTSLVPPIPRQPNAALSISNLRPHCHAGDRIRLWKPKTVRTFCSTQGVPIPLNQEDIKLIKGVSLNSLQPST